MSADGKIRVYRSDDRDLAGGDLDLRMSRGGNGDWYLTIVEHDLRLEAIGPTVRLTTSGAARRFAGVPAALGALWRALGGESEGTSPVPVEEEHPADVQPDDGWEDTQRGEQVRVVAGGVNTSLPTRHGGLHPVTVGPAHDRIERRKIWEPRWRLTSRAGAP